MVVPLTAEKLVEQVRQRAVDEGTLLWTNQKILDAADLAFQHIWDTVRLSGSDHELDRMDIAPTAFTRVEELWYEYPLPEWVGAIRLVEGVISSGTVRPIAAVPANLEQKDHSRTPFMSQQPVWIRSQLGRPGKFSIMGEVGSFTNVRLWFIRRFPPQHYGAASSGTANTIVFTNPPANGTLTRRDNLYVGMDIAFTSGPNIDQIVRVTSFNAATLTAAFTPQLGAAVANGHSYSTIIPLEPEHGEYFIEEVTRRMLARLSNVDHLRATEPQYAELRDRFVASLRQRDNAAPKRIWSRRR